MGLKRIVAAVVAASQLTVGAAAAGQLPQDVPPPVSGRTLTVGPGGQYSTVQAAADAARPGDSVRIAAGVYTGGLSIKTSGSPGKYITFYGQGGTAVIKGRGGSKGLLALGGHSWLRFNSMTFSGSRGFGAHADGAHDLVFQNFGIDGSQDGGLVLLNTSNVLVDGCDIRGTNAEGTSADHEALSLGHGSRDIEVKHCNVHDNGEEGIDVKYTDDARISIHDNVKVYNNVSYGNAQAGLSIWVESSGTVSNVEIVNNMFYGNARGAITFDGDEYDGVNILRNNIYAEGNVSHDAFVSDHNVSGDPGFVNPRAGDFHLKPGATKAIDKGSAASAPAFDLDNKPRPTGTSHDIGAYER